MEENSKKNPQLGLIATPPTYYTTQKARYLGERYKNNLDRLVERIVSNPKTANLQFANNIASVGGIGFFTHSATNSVDERFLEIIMGVPETFDSKLDYDSKVHRVFSIYGAELLSILAGDADIYQEKQVNGYGLNLSWRNLVADAARPRISLERSTLYFSKARVRSFLQGNVSQNILLSEAVIFAVVDDGPMKLVSYRPHELKPDSRRPIQEEPLITGRIPVKRKEQSEKTASLTPLTEPSIRSKEEGEDPSQSPYLSSGKPNQPQSPPALIGKGEGWKEAGFAHDKPQEVPVASSAPSEPSTRELSAVPIAEDVVAGKKTSVDMAAVEPKETEPVAIPPKVDLASLSASPSVPRLADAPKAEVSLKHQPLSQDKQTKMLNGPAVTMPVLKVLQGFVVQIAFVDPRDAQYWAETLERRGFAVSLTETGDSGSMRLRIGNFTGREEAERQLQALRQDGLKGIVLNLPQAYRPEVRPPAVEESAKNLPAIQ